MIDQNLVRVVAEAGEIGPGDVVIEVGPGTGTLTEELIARAGKVIAMEIDRDLAAMLREKFSGEKKFQLIEGDALAGKHAINPELLEACHFSGKPAGARVKLVANLPYNIASPLIIELLIAGADLLAFTVQKEVADRLRAPAGSEAYGPLSVMAQMLSDVELLRTLPPQAFWPPPKIESALVRMRRRDRLGTLASEFGGFVATLFSFRRKTIRKALTQAGYEDVERILAAQGIDPQHRPEVLTPEQILSLFQATRSRMGEASPPRED